MVAAEIPAGPGRHRSRRSALNVQHSDRVRPERGIGHCPCANEVGCAHFLPSCCHLSPHTVTVDFCFVNMNVWLLTGPTPGELSNMVADMMFDT